MRKYDLNINLENKVFMTEIMRKYFDDPAENKLHNGADVYKIMEVEQALSIKFPQDYVEFLLFTNGYEGKLGQSYSVFTPVEQIISNTKNYREHFPWIVFIGTDGGGEMYVIDKREEPLKFGILPYIGSESDFIFLGHTFEHFIEQLYTNDFWDNRKNS